MTPSSKISFIFESIATNLGVLKGEMGQHGAEPVIGRRILYWMKKVHLSQMTNGEFFEFTGIYYNNECRTLDEMTAIERILLDVCDKTYLRLLSDAKNEDEEKYELRKAS